MKASKHEAMHDGRIYYVYLMVDRVHWRFKIGRSYRPIFRSTFFTQDINLSMSVMAGFSRAEAYRIEKHLHNRFRASNICKKAMGEVDGKTEWFSFDCFPACREALREMVAIVPLHRIGPKPPRCKDWFEECFELLADPAFLQVINKPRSQLAC